VASISTKMGRRKREEEVKEREKGGRWRKIT
jgi:hypothetical protein